jgi:peptide/nickel transport system substrate-binding protein
VARSERNSMLKFVPYGDLSTVDPIWTIYTVTRCHGFMVYDTLYGQTGPEQGFVAKPQMVAGHTVDDDGKTWKLTLRDGLMFHDGTKVLARDCSRASGAGARDAFGQTLMQRTNEIAALDDRTVVFRLNKPFGMLPDALGKFTSKIVTREHDQPHSDSAPATGWRQWQPRPTGNPSATARPVTAWHGKGHSHNPVG